MEFRWAALIAIWSMLSGPVFMKAPSPKAPPHGQSYTHAAGPVKAK
jgi:hypothetical protein